MILVNEGSRRIVLAPTADGQPCAECGSEQRVIAVRYQVFGFFKAFCASWSRHYFIECRQCRRTLSAITRADFEAAQGNAVPYGHRFALLSNRVMYSSPDLLRFPEVAGAPVSRPSPLAGLASTIERAAGVRLHIVQYFFWIVLRSDD